MKTPSCQPNQIGNIPADVRHVSEGHSILVNQQFIEPREKRKSCRDVQFQFDVLKTDNEFVATFKGTNESSWFHVYLRSPQEMRGEDVPSAV